MNYYPHHIGDYASATAHLTALEDCFYRRLLDWYYLDEKHLPIDSRAIYRRVRASSEQEREAVDAVLAEFFHKTESGYEHTRCEEEIARSHAKSEERREAANKRWSARKPTPVMQTPCKPDANASSPNAIASVDDAKGMHSQEPIANSQEPKEKKKEAPASRVAPKPPDVPDEVWVSFGTLRRAKRAPVTPVALAGIASEAGKAGLTLAEALTVCCEQSWQGFNAEWYANLQARSQPRQQGPPRQPSPSQQLQQNVIGAISPRPSRTIDVDATEVFTPRLAS